MEQLSAFIQMLLLPLAVFAAGVVVVFVWNKGKEIEKALRDKFGENFTTFQSIVAYAVQAAEQAGLIGLISNIGAEKKRYAIDYIEGQLKGLGLNIDLDVIAAAIEGAIANKWHEMQMLPPSADVVLGGDAAPQPNGPALAKFKQGEKK